MASDIARELRIAVEVHCKLYRYNSAGKKIALGSEIVRLVSQNPRDVVASLERALRERMGSAGSTFMLQYGFLHSFKVSLVYRGGRRGGTAFDPAWYRLGVWPQRMKHKPRLVLAADVQVLPCVYKELPMVLPALPGWPPGRYLLREHRVACGCVGCRQAQGYEVDGAYEEAGDEEGEEGEEGGAAAAMGPGASLEAPAGDAGSCRAPKRRRQPSDCHLSSDSFV